MSLSARYFKICKSYMVYENKAFKYEQEIQRYNELKEMLFSGKISDLKVNVFLKIFDENIVAPFTVYARFPFYYVENGIQYVEYFHKTRDNTFYKCLNYAAHILRRKHRILMRLYYCGDNKYVGTNPINCSQEFLL